MGVQYIVLDTDFYFSYYNMVLLFYFIYKQNYGKNIQ